MSQRTVFFQEMVQIRDQVDRPWVLVGDFNRCRTAEEKNTTTTTTTTTKSFSPKQVGVRLELKSIRSRNQVMVPRRKITAGLIGEQWRNSTHGLMIWK